MSLMGGDRTDRRIPKPCDSHHFFVDVPDLEKRTACILYVAVLFSGGNLKNELFTVSLSELCETVMVRGAAGFCSAKH